MRSILVIGLLLLTSCASRPCCAPAVATAADEGAGWTSEDESAYRGIFLRDRRQYDVPGWVESHEAWLHDVATGDVPVLRNAAARRLLDRGVKDAAWYLIVNLHRDQRTFVATDAIHHLREVFGTDLGYEPNKGYRHQTEAQAAWVAWFRAQPFGDDRELVPLEPKPRPSEAQRDAVRRTLAALRDTDEEEDPDGAQEHAAIMALWELAADTLAPSRHPDDIHLLAEVFGELASRRPRVAAFWNNYGLALLNDGRHEAAEAAYRKALALAPEDAQLQNDLGILLEAMGRLREAEAAYEEALRRRPDDDVAASNLGDVLHKQGRNTEARAAWVRARRLAPSKWHYHGKWIERLP